VSYRRALLGLGLGLGLTLALSSASLLAQPRIAPGQGLHTDRFPVQLTRASGALTGTIRIRKKQSELRAKGRLFKIPFGDILSLEELHPFRKAGKDELTKARLRYVKKRELVKQEDAIAWTRLGNWCRDRGLASEAKQAYEKSVELDPESRDSRRGLKQVKSEGVWKDGRTLAAAQLKALKPGDLEGLAKLGTWASHLLLPEGLDALRLVLTKNTYHKAALRAARRYTDRYQLQTRCRLPFSGRWSARFDSSRHHQKKGYAVYALDLMKVDERGRTHTGRGKKNEDYFTWGSPVYAVADGVVVDARDGFPDNDIGMLGGKAEKHNGVAIRHLKGEHSFYVHLKKDSVKVKVGDQVTAGQIIALNGNSGGTVRPHLHFTMAIPNSLSVPFYAHDYRLLVKGVEIKMLTGRLREGQTVINSWDKE